MMIYTDGVHIIADSLSELHEFARGIGMKREWFQDRKHPHYDITSNGMRKAVMRGRPKPIVIDSRSLARIARVTTR